MKQRLLDTLGLDLRSGEARAAWLLFALHFLLLAFQYAAKSLRQSTYIDALGAERLPFVYLLIALLSFPLLAIHGRLVDRVPQRPLLVGSSLAIAASLFVFWGLFHVGGVWVSVAFYLWVSIVGIFLVSQFWSYALHLFDPRQAKRLFGLVGAGGILGSIAGGQIARVAGLRLDTYGALPVAAVLLAAMAALLARSRDDGHADSLPLSPDQFEEARSGFDLVRRSKYLQLIGGLVLLMTMVSQIVDLQFAWAIEASTTSLEERTAAYGNLYSIMGFAAFGFQVLLTSRIHRRWGVGFAMRVLPAVDAAGSAAFLAAAAFFPALLLPAAWALKIGENGLRYSLDQATRELLFQPLPAAERPRAKAFVDVFVQRAAKGLAALVLLGVSFGWLRVEQTAILSLVLVALWWSLTGAARARYVASFRRALERPDYRADRRLDLSDATTLEILFEGLGSADPREVLHSLELLDANGRGRLVPPLMLHHRDPVVRAKTLEVLRRSGRACEADLVEGCLSDPEPEVRAEATRALAVLSPQGLRGAMFERLRDPDAGVRAAAVAYLAASEETEGRLRADFVLEEMLADGSPATRVEAARALSEILDPHHQNALVRLLYDADPKVVRGAVAAVRRRTDRGARNPLYIPILVSLLRDRRLKHEARSAIVVYGERFLPALEHFMNDRQEDIWVRRALPKTIASIGGRGALVTLEAGLGANDAFLRRKVIEALVALKADGGVGRVDPRLVEGEIAAECRGYLSALFSLWSLTGPEELLLRGPAVIWNGQNPHLLLRLLSDRLDHHRHNLFGLLALIYPVRDIRSAHLSLLSERQVSRAHALEYLDNVLEGEIRRWVFAVIDDLPPPERLRLSKKLFDLAPGSPRSTLERLVLERPAGDADAAWLTAAALHFIREREMRALFPLIRQAAERDRDPLVQETTECLLEGL